MGRKQHFVPQFLLKNFASDSERRRISLFYLPGSKVVKGASIKDQAYRKNLYGSDQNLEEYFRAVETKVSAIIDRIISTENIDLTPGEETMLKHLVSLQINRTPEQISGLQSQFDKMMKIVLRHDPRVKDYLKDITIKITSPYHFLFVIALRVTPALFDLKVSLLKNGSEEEILIGQHPAVVSNPVLYLKQWPGSLQGVASKGALILLPVSPQHAIALYDRRRYGLRNFERIGVLSHGDVGKINTLQFCYTTDCVYFHEGGREIEFDRYKERTEEFRASDKNILNLFEGTNGKGRRSEIIRATHKEPPIRPVFDFIEPKVFAMRENLGPSMDIARDEVRHIAYRMFDKGSTPPPELEQSSDIYYLQSEEE